MTLEVETWYLVIKAYLGDKTWYIVREYPVIHFYQGWDKDRHWMCNLQTRFVIMQTGQ